MVGNKRRITWDLTASCYFEQAISFIKKTSPQGADKLKKDILASVMALVNEPEKKYAADKYKVNNDGRYRAYEIHRFRISYFVSTEYIRIVRIRHTSMEPQEY